MEQVKYTADAVGLSMADMLVGANSTYGVFYQVIIFKGAMPSISEIASNPRTYYTSTRLQDQLLNYSYSGITKTAPTLNSNKLSDIPEVAATQSGTATWCAILGYPTLTFAMVGDISTLDGDGFLKIPDVNILVGTAYKVIGLTVTLPLEYSY